MRTLLVAFTIILLTSCHKNKDIDLDYVTTQFKKHASAIQNVAFNVQRIDTFPGGDVWNHTGIAVIEKDTNDPVFGFSFYGKRNDVPEEYI